MKPSDKLKAAVAAFEGVTWSNAGDAYPHSDDPTSIHPAWVKFGLQKSELGWRTLEFLAWATTDMIRAGERMEFFPTAPPPHLNTTGDCLSFVIEIHPQNNDQEERISKIAEFLNQLRENYWNAPEPDSSDVA
jgi:hypothetical protein